MSQNDDFYKKLRAKIRKWAESSDGKTNKWAEYIMAAPDLFHLLCKLAIDRDVPAKEKAKLAGAIAYFVSPVDLMPEMLLGPAGLLDDIALAAYVLNGVINRTSPEIVRRHWAGEGDVIELIQHILEVADEMLGSGLVKKLKGFL
ncbi:DUF1232 domain-containing protein [Marinobacteraceae bacterium S3BR75-40.1]